MFNDCLCLLGPSELPAIVDLYAAGKLKVDEYITFKLSLDQINDGFKYMHDGKSIRSTVYFHEVPKE
jgi:S-(hydroxymethyl)glutathione dehydrogenase/alcohol dehydrogenase